MIEIQCTSCQTRYRIDERILPDDTPTFKCSRCGHVFSAEPRKQAASSASPEGVRGAKVKPAPPPSFAVDEAEAAPPSAAAAPRADAPAAATTAQGPAATAQQEPSAPFAAAGPAAKPPPQFKPRPAGSAGRRAAAQAPPAARERAAESPRGADLAESAASQAPPAAPQAAPEEPAPVRHDTEELRQRGFREEPADEAEKAGANLAFDFSDEPGSQGETFQSYAEKKWEVGDTDPSSPQPPRPKRRIRISDFNGDDADEGLSLNQALNRDQDLGRQAGHDFDRLRPEEISAQAYRLEAELRGRSYRLHSAGFFMALFALVILGFGILTMTISSAPIASAELLSALPMVGSGLEPAISPARRVALGQVEARYTTLKGDQSALIISGTVENVTSTPLGAVQIEAALTGVTQESLRSQTIYCGNNLSSKMIGEMTPREIEFFEKLDAPRSFTLAPQTSAPFVIVFIGPPAGAAHFQLRVVRADPAAAPAPVTSAGG
jgi:predicted Zn finger-like uncharacterized protein